MGSIFRDGDVVATGSLSPALLSGAIPVQDHQSTGRPTLDPVQFHIDTHFLLFKASKMLCSRQRRTIWKIGYERPYRPRMEYYDLKINIGKVKSILVRKSCGLAESLKHCRFLEEIISSVIPKINVTYEAFA